MSSICSHSASWNEETSFCYKDHAEHGSETGKDRRLKDHFQATCHPWQILYVAYIHCGTQPAPGDNCYGNRVITPLDQLWRWESVIDYIFILFTSTAKTFFLYIHCFLLYDECHIFDIDTHVRVFLLFIYVQSKYEYLYTYSKNNWFNLFLTIVQTSVF